MQTYTFNSQQIRIQNQDGEIWFCGADVARAIGYRNPAEAIADNVSAKHSRLLDLRKKGRKPIFISEAGIYELIMKSNLPAAVPFQDWVYEQVLPSIRQTGQYAGQMPLTELGTLLEDLPALVAKEAADRTKHPFKVRDKAIVSYDKSDRRQCTILDFLGNYVCISLPDGTTDIVGASNLSLLRDSIAQDRIDRLK